MKEQTYSYEEAEKLILAPETKLISFDIFDTLITRPVLKPEDLFYIIERKAAELFDDENFSYETLRLDAERLAYTYAREHRNSEEAEYDEIYNKLRTITALDEEKTEKLKKLEFETELQYIRPRASGRELFELALSTGKRIVLISDIYFRRNQLENIVSANGYTEHERCDVSGDYGLRKSSGNLFIKLSESYKIPHSQWLHIGDNPISDIKRPQELGINTVHLPSVSSIFLKHKDFWHSNLDSFQTPVRIVLGIIANKYFDTPLKTWENNTDAAFLTERIWGNLSTKSDGRIYLNALTSEIENLMTEYIKPELFAAARKQ